MAAADVSFGAELKDGFRPVNAWVGEGIEWLDDIQQFYRERSAIEKEYSAKLSALAKKFFERKNRKQSPVSVGATPTVTPGSLECASMTTWGTQLATLESRAGEHDQFGNALLSQVAEPLRILNGRCEDLRRQHAEFAAKLEKERDTTYGELRKQKGKYDSECQDVEKSRKKTDSDHSSQKNQAAHQAQLANMSNAKNTYLIALAASNKQKERYYNGYVPDLLDSMQNLSQLRISKLNNIWLQAANIETATLNRNAEYTKHLASEIPRNNPSLDSMMFVRHNACAWQQPGDFVFEPSSIWHDDSDMARSEAAKTFLRNVLAKSKAQLAELRREADSKRRELDTARRQRDSGRSDPIDASREHLAAHQIHHDAERRKINTEVEVATIITAVGDLSVGARPHSLRPQTFKIPTNCDLCGDRIWGLSAKGFDCPDCGFCCHSKCEMRVPADCPGECGKDEKRRLKVERQGSAKDKTVAESDAIPERTASVSAKPSAPNLGRSGTVDSMSTLSSGYATSRQPSHQALPDGAGEAEENGRDSPPAAAAPKPRLGGSRLKAPPPAAYKKWEEPDEDGGRQKGKMLYAYTATGADEVSVSEHDSIAVLEPDDGSGWMKVSSSAGEGLVPASYVELGPMPSPSSSQTAHAAHPSLSDTDRHSQYSASSVSLAGSTGAAPRKKGPAVAPRRGAKKVKHVEAMYPYEARTDAEHTMEEGERFVLVKKDAGDGWSEVERGGVVKAVPTNYVKDV
ncbi:MAG: hypothetical protein Q9159_006269 [Coniocarpon cinnabarinum]